MAISSNGNKRSKLLPLSPEEIKNLSVKLEKVKSPGLSMGYQLFLEMQKDETERMFALPNTDHAKKFRESDIFKNLSPSTKMLIEAIAKDFKQEEWSMLDEEERQKQAAFAEQFAGDAQAIEAYLLANSEMAIRFKAHLNQLEANKEKAKRWIEWVADPFKPDGFIGGTMKALSKLPPPLRDIFDDLDNACEYIRQMARLKAMQYDPDLVGDMELAKKEAAIGGVSAGLGAVGKTAALVGLAVSGLALAPVAAAIAGFGIAISETIATGLAIRTLWTQWNVEKSKQYPGRRWELFANVLKPIGKTMAALAIGIAAVAATTVGLPVLAAIGATGIFISSVISAVTEGIKLAREWKAKPGETPAETRARRLNNVCSFVNKLAVVVLTGVLAAAAIIAIANPIGLAVVASALVTAAVVAMAVSLASFIIPKMPALFTRLSNWWKGNKNKDKEENKDKNKLIDKEVLVSDLQEDKLLAARLEQERRELEVLDVEPIEPLPQADRAYLPTESLENAEHNPKPQVIDAPTSESPKPEDTSKPNETRPSV
jgi:hypothetical protein